MARHFGASPAGWSLSSGYSAAPTEQPPFVSHKRPVRDFLHDADHWHADCSGIKRLPPLSLEFTGVIPIRGHMSSTHVRMTIEWSVPIGQTRPITMALHSLAADARPTRGC